MNSPNRILRDLAPDGSRLAAGVVALLIIVATVLLLPVAEQPLGEVKPFLPMFATTVVITEYLTAYMLYTHFRSSRMAYLAALASASVFVAIMAAVQVLIFPGVFSETGLLGAGAQSAVWIWTFWHGGYPFFVLLALLLLTPAVARRRAGVLSGWAHAELALAAGAAITLATLAVADGGQLPPLIDGAAYTRLIHSPAAPVVLGINVLALLACLAITRLRDLLSAWLAVALLASLADVALTLVAGARYSAGWYAARCLSMVSSSVVLGVLVWQTSNLYRQLARAHEALAERAVRDALTGAHNRGHFIDQFPRDLRRASRERLPLAVLMVDIDYFKAYNDMYGHQKGDECLRAVAHAMQRVLRRPGDYLARYGGEEFVVVLPNTDTSGALHVAAAVREAVAALAIVGAQAADRNVTISIGIATFNPDFDTFDADVMVRRADDALYRAKREGRDRAELFDSKRPDLITELRDP